jgi:hypothetical protein
MPDSNSNPGVAISSSPLSNTTICLRFTLLDETKIMEYQETIKIKTDEFGLVNTFLVVANKQMDTRLTLTSLYGILLIKH